jgi:hypothetical protein
VFRQQAAGDGGIKSATSAGGRLREQKLQARDQRGSTGRKAWGGTFGGIASERGLDDSCRQGLGAAAICVLTAL